MLYKNFALPDNARMNLDQNMHKFFVRFDDEDHAEIVDLPLAEEHQLNPDIYFSPSYCPLISASDYTKGTCFENLFIPTAAHFFVPARDQQYRMEHLPTDITVDFYIEYLDQSIAQSIHNIYHTNKTVILAYSGGVDSLVLLSYIIGLGYGDRTALAIMKNWTQGHDSCLHKNTEALDLVCGLIEQWRSQLLAVYWYDINVNDVCEIYNRGDLVDIKCYSAKHILSCHSDTAFIFGWHGNQVLLHKDIFLDEILLKQPGWIARLKGHIDSLPDFYTRGLKHYRCDRDFISLARRHLVPKPWSLLNGTNRNRVYDPLADNNLLLLTRSLDFGKIHPDIILDAKVARTLISLRCDKLSAYIGRESIKECDMLAQIDLPSDRLDRSRLKIPDTVRHNDQGLRYVRNELEQISTRGYLPINSAVSLRSLQFIASHYTNCTAT